MNTDFQKDTAQDKQPERMEDLPEWARMLFRKLAMTNEAQARRLRYNREPVQTLGKRLEAIITAAEDVIDTEGRDRAAIEALNLAVHEAKGKS